MGPSPDSPFRLRLRVAIKVAVLGAIVTVCVVAVQYLASSGSVERAARAVIALDGIAPDHARRAEFAGRVVWVLNRSRATRVALAAEQGRAEEGRWLVVVDRGPKHACPLVWERERLQFRETCSSARYDAAGRALAGADEPRLQRLAYTLVPSADSLRIDE